MLHSLCISYLVRWSVHVSQSQHLRNMKMNRRWRRAGLAVYALGLCSAYILAVTPRQQIDRGWMQNLLDLHSRLRWAQSVTLSLSWCVLCSSTIVCRQYDAAVVFVVWSCLFDFSSWDSWVYSLHWSLHLASCSKSKWSFILNLKESLMKVVRVYATKSLCSIHVFSFSW